MVKEYLAARDRGARMRLLVVGELLAAPPARGMLAGRLRELSSKTWRHPTTGEDVRFGASTIERWYLRARRARDPLEITRTAPRADIGQSRVVDDQVAQALDKLCRSYPTWNVRLLHDNLRAALGEHPVPSYSTVRRHLIARGWARQKTAKAAALDRQHHADGQREVRSYEVPCVGSLWHLDGHHCSLRVLTSDGRWEAPLAICILDDHSRMGMHVQWYLAAETTEVLTHAFCQALQRRGVPRMVLSDNGSAMISGEFKAGLHRLGILDATTQPRSAYQNGKQEVFWRRLEERLVAMLAGVPDLTLKQLNDATHAWIEQEYHRTAHRELECSPLERFMAAQSVLRACPDAQALRQAFRIEITRQQRRSDGTVSVDGRRFEIPQAWRHWRELRLRYARWDLRSVDLVDPGSGTVLTSLYPLDKSRYADGHRRPLQPVAPAVPAGGPDRPPGVAPLLRQMLEHHALTGMPVPYLPFEPTDASTP